VASNHQFQWPPKETSTDEDRWYDVLEQPEEERPFQRRYNIYHSRNLVNHDEQNLIASANDPKTTGAEAIKGVNDRASVIRKARQQFNAQFQTDLEGCCERTTNAEGLRGANAGYDAIVSSKTGAVKESKELEGNFGFPRLNRMTCFNSAMDGYAYSSWPC
jgi:hypothetical protein